MSTLRQISEQVLRRHYGGNLSQDNQIKRKEIDLLVVQAINARFKMERFNNLNAGSAFMDVPSALIAQYIVPVPVATMGPNLLAFTSSAWKRVQTTSFGAGLNLGTKVMTLVNLSSVTLASNSQLSYKQSFVVYPKMYRFRFTALSSLFFRTPAGAENVICRVFQMGEEGPNDPLYEVVISNTGTNVEFSTNLTFTQPGEVFVEFLVNAPLSGAYSGTVTVGNIAFEHIEVQKVVPLPAQPIALPMNLGVWEVSDERYPDMPYIPMPTGSYGLTKGLSVSNLQGNIGFEVVGSQLHFKKDISHVEKMLIKLLVNDVDISRVDDLLPIPADMEIQVITDVLNIISGAQKKDIHQDNVDRP